MELKTTDDENEKAICQNLTKTDLLAIKRKIFEIRQALDRLKSKASCAKKHNPNDLKISINKWKIVCQNALQIIYSELKESGQNPKITDILNMLGISKIVVNYSIVDDTFI
ncbi:PREDICTED: uncharacterized protein LOC105366488 [Ceratosolen solmsi marchali]|uniref:Uncharacterized protein LOC105366488 n=1 Tax=Ceratosolen solmsi marchali TaxID=326594 RepID=A0AAJ6YS87_9HYME|nr:PREDICTED: uncharacterized protein LOC105366488 [Ceratosolen solmsi marchali]